MTISKLSDQQKSDVVSKLEAGANVTHLADEFNVSRSTIYRARDQAATFASQPKTPSYTEFGVSGLQRFSGTVREDYNRTWQNLQTMVPLVKEMLDHPIVGATMFAVEAYLKTASWSIIPGGDSPADLAAAEFLEEQMHSMSTSWTDFVSQALSMLSYGFAPFEICYLRTDSGRIGWRKFAFRSQDTLAPGHEWKFDDQGGIRGMYQQAVWNKPEVFIPIEKMILFRTTAAKQNPQGRSLLRPAYIAFYMSKNLGEVEAISAERLGGGLPVIYLGSDSSHAGTNSDFEYAKTIVSNVRSDEQSGIVFPRAKQGYADAGKGILFELVSPPSKGAIDFDKMVQRYNIQIAQTLLAQVIFLGGGANTGSNALAVELQRIFEQSLRGFLLNIVDTLNRFPVPRLFSFNTFNIGENYPKFSARLPNNTPVLELLNAITAAVSGGVLTKDGSVETLVRTGLQLPPLLENETGDAEFEQGVKRAREKLGSWVKGKSSFIDDRDALLPFATNQDGERLYTLAEVKDLEPGDIRCTTLGCGTVTKSGGVHFETEFAEDRDLQPGVDDDGWTSTTNALQAKLERIYSDWTARIVKRIQENKERGQRRVLGIFPVSRNEMAGIDVSLQELEEELGDALAIGLMDAVGVIHGEEFNPGAAIEANAETQRQLAFLSTSLIPSIRGKIEEFLSSPSAADFNLQPLTSELKNFGPRVALYAGASWLLLNRLFGQKTMKQVNTKIYWLRDSSAASCADCLEFGNREYASFDALLAASGSIQPGSAACLQNCRCRLINVREGGEAAA